jgi:quercetin dioxygenase-like cupin family protein
MSSETQHPARVVKPEDLESDESTPGVVRETIFQTENNVMVRSRIAGGTESAWHHHGERQAYGYILEGSGWVEYGSDGKKMEASAGEYFTIEPGMVHRDVNPSEDDAVVLVCFVGTGPVVVNVDEPGSE